MKRYLSFLGLAAETRESKFSIDQILEKAQEYLDQYDYEMAQKFCQRAMEMNPDHAKALELTSTLLLEVRLRFKSRMSTVCQMSNHLL